MKKTLSLLLSIVMLMCICSPLNAQAASKPASTSITSISKKTTSITVKWAKISNISGYQIQYATNSSFDNSKKVTAGKTATSKTISSLKSGKKYYVRVRTYKTVNSKKVYSSWSKSKYVTTNKASSGTSTSSTVYVTPTGKRYHKLASCGGVNSSATTLSKAKGMGLTPCQKCAM